MLNDIKLIVSCVELILSAGSVSMQLAWAEFLQGLFGAALIASIDSSGEAFLVVLVQF